MARIETMVVAEKEHFDLAPDDHVYDVSVIQQGLMAVTSDDYVRRFNITILRRL